jgi:hypothetical protein
LNVPFVSLPIVKVVACMLRQELRGSTQWQVPNAYCCRGENDERACAERRRHSRCQVGEDQGGDLGRSDDIGKLPQEDHRRLDGAGERKLAAEVASISGDECEPLGGCLASTCGSLALAMPWSRMWVA